MNKIPDNAISHQIGWKYESVISVKTGKKSRDKRETKTQEKIKYNTKKQNKWYTTARTSTQTRHETMRYLTYQNFKGPYTLYLD